jgi:cell division septum initiation protein DivIVA
MDVHDKIDEIVAYLESARAMPMSSSAVVNRTELLSKLDAVRTMLPGSLRAAEMVLDQREALLAEAQANAERIAESALQEQQRLVSEHGVLVAAETKAEEILAAAIAKADDMRGEVDDYVDAKLAHLEVAVDKILDTVRQGRERLRGTNTYGALGGDEDRRGSPVDDS